mmetsp:Transcript_11627/g.37280  ORF Transcript_11627/g.37280 Transcript_11627/m.37280 type:complete len:237 (-) Transcript_11627:793-1503(-)
MPNCSLVPNRSSSHVRASMWPALRSPANSPSSKSQTTSWLFELARSPSASIARNISRVVCSSSGETGASWPVSTSRAATSWRAMPESVSRSRVMSLELTVGEARTSRIRRTTIARSNENVQTASRSSRKSSVIMSTTLRPTDLYKPFLLATCSVAKTDAHSKAHPPFRRWSQPWQSHISRSVRGRSEHFGGSSTFAASRACASSTMELGHGKSSEMSTPSPVCCRGPIGTAAAQRR